MLPWAHIHVVYDHYQYTAVRTNECDTYRVGNPSVSLLLTGSFSHDSKGIMDSSEKENKDKRSKSAKRP